jgi:hypothetical protein
MNKFDVADRPHPAAPEYMGTSHYLEQEVVSFPHYDFMFHVSCPLPEELRLPFAQQN